MWPLLTVPAPSKALPPKSLRKATSPGFLERIRELNVHSSFYEQAVSDILRNRIIIDGHIDYNPVLIFRGNKPALVRSKTS